VCGARERVVYVCVACGCVCERESGVCVREVCVRERGVCVRVVCVCGVWGCVCV